MTKISFDALKGMTVGEVLKMQKQAKQLPEGFKMTYKKPSKKIKKVQEILNEV